MVLRFAPERLREVNFQVVSAARQNSVVEADCIGERQTVVTTGQRLQNQRLVLLRGPNAYRLASRGYGASVLDKLDKDAVEQPRYGRL